MLDCPLHLPSDFILRCIEVKKLEESDDMVMCITVVNILNCFFQGIAAVATVVGIWIAVKQISGKAKANLKMKTEFKLNETTLEGDYVELVIHLVNLSMAPVYISELGIQLWEKRKLKYTMRIFNIPFVLASGQSKAVSGQYISEMIDDRASLHDEVKIYAICQMDKIYYEKKTIAYDEFKHESEKISKRLDKIKKHIIL